MGIPRARHALPAAPADRHGGGNPHRGPRRASREFYDTWYRPERMVLVLGRRHRSRRRRAARPRNPRSARRPRPPRNPSRVSATWTRHSSSRAASTPRWKRAARMSRSRPSRPTPSSPTTAASRLKYLPRTLALHHVEPPVRDPSRKRRARPSSADSSASRRQFDTFRNASIEMNCRPDQVAGRARGRRARSCGAHSSTVSRPMNWPRFVAEMRNDLDQAVKTAATRRSARAGRRGHHRPVRPVRHHPSGRRPGAVSAGAASRDPPPTAPPRSALRGRRRRAGRFLWPATSAFPNPPTQSPSPTPRARRLPSRPPPKTEQGVFAYTKFGPGRLGRGEEGRGRSRRHPDQLQERRAPEPQAHRF